MQRKISAFYKPSFSFSFKIVNPSQLGDDIEETPPPLISKITEPEIRITYKRRTPKPDLNSNGEEIVEKPISSNTLDDIPVKPVSTSAKILNKKRSYAQLYLELGQSDFYLHTCSVCGLKFARGDEDDEKVHKEFHKNHTHGIQFKGWRNERVITADSSERTRIILVLDSDPLAQRSKVQEVGKMIETELGLSEGWLLHKLCKVYLFISGQRIAGCLVTEPIKSAYKVFSSSAIQKDSNSTDRSNSSTVLQFGTINFQQEVTKRAPSVYSADLVEQDMGAEIVWEEEAVSAICGVRAIWVTPFNRRKHIATKLLDAARMSFCEGYVIQHSQLAFSQPTSTGKALALRYSGRQSFLVYHSGLNCSISD